MLCAWREFYDPTGLKLALTEVDEDNLTHVDTSALMLHSSVFDLNGMWSKMPRRLSPVCDRVFFTGIKHRQVMQCFTRRRTVGFTTHYRRHYEGLGLPVPDNARVAPIEEITAYLTSVEGVRDTVNRLGFWPMAI